MIRRLLIRTAAAATLAALLLPTAARAQALDVAGVRYEPTLQLGGSTLHLNGAGIRYKAVFKVYTAGLYLATKATTAEAALAAPGPRRMHIVMLREIDANELGKLFTRGMQENSTREEFGRAIAGTVRIGEIFASKKKLVAGESFGVDWLPGTGTVVLVNGKPQGEPIAEPEFFNALLRIWLGKSPADAQLKEALLGKAAKTKPDI